MYFDDDDGNYVDGDDGALIPDQDLIVVWTNNYFNLPSERNLPPAGRGRY